MASVRRGVNRGALGSQWPEGDVGSLLRLCRCKTAESGVPYAPREWWEPDQGRCPRRLVQPRVSVARELRAASGSWKRKPHEILTAWI